MNVLFRFITICCAALYMWVSGALFWHDHGHSPSKDIGQDCDQHTNNTHSHDAETCSICFFIHNGSITLPKTIIFPNLGEKDIMQVWSDRVTINYSLLSPQQESNKDPPVLS